MSVPYLYPGSDSMPGFLYEVLAKSAKGKRKELTLDEQRELLSRAQKGDEDAIKEVVEMHLCFVINIAKKYGWLRYAKTCCGMDIRDVINYGVMGILEAIKRFELDRDFKFITYALWWIRQNITSALADHESLIRRPRQQVWKSDKKKVKSRVDRAKIVDLRRITERGEPGERDSYTQGTLLKIPDAAIMPAETVTDPLFQSEVRVIIEEHLSQLLPREQLVLRLRFGFEGNQEHSLTEIGDVMGLSRERIRQIEEEAKHKLRRLLCKFLNKRVPPKIQSEVLRSAKSPYANTPKLYVSPQRRRAITALSRGTLR